MTIYLFKTRSYAISIYFSGTQRFTARDGYSGIPVDYHAPVKTFAAGNFTLGETETALASTWITQTEYDETIAQRTPDSPQSSPSVAE